MHESEHRPGERMRGAGPVRALTVAVGASCIAAASLRAQVACRLIGTVVDDASGEPISSASVWVEDPESGRFLRGVASSAAGGFQLELPACVPVIMRVQTLGYRPVTEALEAPTGAARVVTVRLERAPLEVEELDVEIGRSDRLAGVGYYTRQAWVESTGEDFADFYDPEEVSGRARTQHSLTEIVGSSRINFLYPSSCRPSYYVDGERVRRAFNFSGWLNLLARPSDVEGIEIYRPMHGAIPDEFREANSNMCGAILVWTKRTTIPRVDVELCEPTHSAGERTLSGVVTDRLTGVPLPAARVRLGVDEGVEVETITDGQGRFRFCDVAAEPLWIQARYGEATGATLLLGRGTTVPKELDLYVPVTYPG